MNTGTRKAEFREDAQLVIEALSEKEDVQLDYSPASVSWLGEYIDRHRAALSDGDKRVLREKFGAFLGESILRNCGGRWEYIGEDRWMIAFSEHEGASPFELIGEHLDHHTALTQAFERSKAARN